MHKTTATLQNKVRIIGGKWRGRKLDFPALATLRPTHDRIRETLFNWLEPYIQDALCLDLYAGSGAMGFEAISRGAKYAVLVDNAPEVIKHLKRNREAMHADNIEIVQAVLPQAELKLAHEHFDIIFLDPPYHQGLIPTTLSWLLAQQLVKPGTLVYIEHELEADWQPPARFELRKQKQTATLRYALWEVVS